MSKKERRHYDIVEFAPWMGDQVADLNVLQYGGTREEKRAEFARITEHPFARDKGVAICAIDGETVVGVQTYRYWPYRRGADQFYSLQSGGTLVHPEHRGQGLFMRMLTAGNAILERRGVDFVMGFPVPMSFGGFIKDAWYHADSPTWFVTPVRPLKMVMERLRISPPKVSPPARKVELDLEDLSRVGSQRRTTLDSAPSFLDYRYGRGRAGGYDVREYRDGGRRAVILGKPRDSNGFAEYTIGDLLLSDGRAATGRWALRRLLKELRAEGQTSACSILVGSGAFEHLAIVTSLGFLPTPKRGLFIAKPISMRAADWLASRFQWNLLHADIDTW